IIAASPTVYDMAAYPKTLSGKTVTAYVNTHTDLSDELYREGKLVSDNQRKSPPLFCARSIQLLHFESYQP
ncbi:hypothetical protein, partial [Alistipes putredinis]|uniref:hypothetical protein n=1 Tax=Alistipes putredinis TaxID=28117 RepID=UPI003AB5858F